MIILANEHIINLASPYTHSLVQLSPPTGEAALCIGWQLMWRLTTCHCDCGVISPKSISHLLTLNQEHHRRGEDRL